jgi:hypothetical protein
MSDSVTGAAKADMARAKTEKKAAFIVNDVSLKCEFKEEGLKIVGAGLLIERAGEDDEDEVRMEGIQEILILFKVVSRQEPAATRTPLLSKATSSTKLSPSSPIPSLDEGWAPKSLRNHPSPQYLKFHITLQNQGTQLISRESPLPLLVLMMSLTTPKGPQYREYASRTAPTRQEGISIG